MSNKEVKITWNDNKEIKENPKTKPEGKLEGKQPESIDNEQPKLQFFFENLEEDGKIEDKKIKTENENKKKEKEKSKTDKNRIDLVKKDESTELVKKPGRLTKEEKQEIKKEKKGEFDMTVKERVSERRMLTTKEFIGEVRELGLEVDTQDREGMLVKNSKGIYVVYVPYTKRYSFSINFSDFDDLPEELKSKLYRLVCDYAGTPIYERKELQKFYMKFKMGTEQSLVNFLNRDMNFDSFEPNSNYKSYKFLTQFTQEEIDEMKEKFGVTLSDFEQIPVEEFEEYEKEDKE